MIFGKFEIGRSSTYETMDCYVMRRDRHNTIPRTVSFGKYVFSQMTE